MPRKFFPLRPGHMNFKHRYKTVHGRITTLDEAIALVEKRAKDKAARVIRDKDAPPRGIKSMAQAQALANMHSKLMTKRGRIKMPEFSIQKIE